MVRHIAEDTIEAKFTKLVTEGHNTLLNCGFDGSEYRQYPATNAYTRFRTEAMNLIQKVCGPSSGHYLTIKGLAESERTALNLLTLTTTASASEY